MSIVLWRVMVLIVEGGIAGRPVHHARRLSVHHVAHRRIRTVCPARTCGQWWKHGSIALVDHRLDDSTPRVDEPVVNLKDRQPRVLCQLLLLVFRRVRMREVLKQPRPEDVGRDLGEDAPLLLVLLTRRIVVFLAGALAAADTRVTRVTGTTEEDGRVKDAATRVASRSLRVRRRTPFPTRTPFTHGVGIRGVQTGGRLLTEGSWRAPASGAACVVVATRAGVRQRRGGWPDVRRAGSVRVAGAVGGAPRPAAVQTVPNFGGFRALPVVDHQVDRHLALQAADVPVAEVVAQLVDLFELEEVKPEDLNRLDHQRVHLRIRDVVGFLLSDLFGEDSDVLVEALRRADVTARDTGFARCTRRQLALLEDQREKREQGVSVDGVLVAFVDIGHR